MMGNQRGRFREELPLRVDLTKLTTGMIVVGLDLQLSLSTKTLGHVRKAILTYKAPGVLSNDNKQFQG